MPVPVPMPLPARVSRTAIRGSCALLCGRDARQEFLFPHFLRHPGDELENHIAMTVHQESFRRGIDSEVDGGTALLVEGHLVVWITESCQPFLRLFALIRAMIN